MQAKLAHTPGPWDVQYQEGNKPYVVADQGRGWNNPVVCSLYEDVTTSDSVTLGAWLEAYDNAEANAHLIAAAPELLKALKEAAKFLEMAFNHDGDVFGIDHNDATDALSAAYVAMFKAERIVK